MLKLVVASLLLSAVLPSINALGSFDKEMCAQQMADGLQILEEVYTALADDIVKDRKEHLRRTRSLPVYKDFAVEGGGVDAFTKCDGMDKLGRNCTVPPKKKSSAAVKHRFPRLIIDETEEVADPLAVYAEQLHKYLSSSDAACSPHFRDLNSITEEQLYGFLSTMATRSPGPFCELCHHFTQHIYDNVLHPFVLLSGPNHALFSALFSRLPSPRSLCSALAPACYNSFIKIGNLNFTLSTESAQCLECWGCTGGLSVLQHLVFLNKELFHKIYDGFLKDIIITTICHDICCSTDFPPELQIDFPTCMEGAETGFERLWDSLGEILKPERFCVLEMGWCELNETPNGLHCLREACQDIVNQQDKLPPQLVSYICTLIPDRPAEADKFLNIQGKSSKTEKRMKAEEMERNQNGRTAEEL